MIYQNSFARWRKAEICESCYQYSSLGDKYKQWSSWYGDLFFFDPRTSSAKIQIPDGDSAHNAFFWQRSSVVLHLGLPYYARGPNKPNRTQAIAKVPCSTGGSMSPHNNRKKSQKSALYRLGYSTGYRLHVSLGDDDQTASASFSGFVFPPQNSLCHVTCHCKTNSTATIAIFYWHVRSWDEYVGCYQVR